MRPKDYNKKIEIKKDKSLGYEYFLDKEHPLACNGVGKVYYHRHILSVHMNKWIDSSYHVHHKDENRANNHIDNLEMISPKMHSRKHKLKEGGKIYLKECLRCGKRFRGSKEDSKYCSRECTTKDSHKKLSNKIDKKLLQRLVYLEPTTSIAKRYNCSDTALGKLSKKYGIEKPPRGYWTARKSNKVTFKEWKTNKK